MKTESPRKVLRLLMWCTHLTSFQIGFKVVFNCFAFSFQMFSQMFCTLLVRLLLCYFTQKFLQIPQTESSEAYSEALRANHKLFETKLQNDFPSDNEEQNHADSILTGVKNGALLSESEWALVAQSREGNPISIY